MKATSNSHRLVAYKNEEFLDSPTARSLEVLSEYLEPPEPETPAIAKSRAPDPASTEK
jgi:hypothetical protein